MNKQTPIKKETLEEKVNRLEKELEILKLFIELNKYSQICPLQHYPTQPYQQWPGPTYWCVSSWNLADENKNE